MRSCWPRGCGSSAARSVAAPAARPTPAGRFAAPGEPDPFAHPVADAVARLPTVDPGPCRSSTPARRSTRTSTPDWPGVLDPRPRRLAGPADNFFFPRAAYLQLKSCRNAAGDFDGRLYHDYKNDVIADHQLVTTGVPAGQVARGQVLGVDMPEASVRWVPPGVEVNSIGYWQVSYPRLRYVVNGQEHSYAFSTR